MISPSSSLPQGPARGAARTSAGGSAVAGITDRLNPTDAAQEQANAAAALKAGLSGEFADIWEDYASGTERLTDKTNDLNAKLAEAVEIYGEASPEVANIRDALYDTAAAQDALAESTSEAIRQMIFQQAVAKATGDTQLELARALGVLDEESYNIARATEAIIDQGTIDFVDPEEVGQLEAIARVIDDLKKKKVEITFDAVMDGVKLVDAADLAARIAAQIGPLVQDKMYLMENFP
jgi:hypothetical protein